MSTGMIAKPAESRWAVDAALVMVIGMGFGRFAFTAIYPHMIDEGVITLGEGGWAASSNYAGYLVGAFLGMRARSSSAHRLCLWSLLGTAFCLAILAVFQSAAILFAVRGIAGAFSALSMIAASLWLLEHRRYVRGAPVLYSGVGLGIAFSAELLALGTWAGLRSSGLWLLLGIVSLVVGAIAAPGLMAGGSEALSNGTNRDVTSRPTVRQWPLVALYGLAGFGYIITATYLPTLVKSALPGLDAAHVWAVFGLGAAPSCFLWHRINNRIGLQKSLFLNLSVQAIGVILPVAFQNVGGYLLSAMLVGGTFMGTVTIAIPAAQNIARHTKTNLAAMMTLVYGSGQIAGPIVASAFYNYSHSFSMSLIAAASALVVAAIVSLVAL